MDFWPGHRVQLFGLQQRPELNQRIGVVIESKHADSDRYRVLVLNRQVKGKAETLRIRPTSLVLIGDDCKHVVHDFNLFFASAYRSEKLKLSVDGEGQIIVVCTEAVKRGDLLHVEHGWVEVPHPVTGPEMRVDATIRQLDAVQKEMPPLADDPI